MNNFLSDGAYLMLYFVVAWTVLTVVCFLIGTGLLNAFKADCFERLGDRFVIAVWLGVVVLSISLLAASLVMPLSLPLSLAIAFSFVALSFLSDSTCTDIIKFCSSLSQPLILVFFLLEIVVAALTAKQVTWYDTGLYHFGSIRWLAEHGAVPGLALIHSKFGFTSSWFALAAPLNPEIFGSRVSAVTNGFVFLISSFHFFISLAHVFKRNAQLSDWFATVSLLITIPLFIFTSFMSAILISPSPDIPVILLTEVIAWAILIIKKNSTLPVPKVKAPVLDAQMIPLLLSAGAVTMKLSGLPLLVGAYLFYIISTSFFSIKRVLWGGATSILLLSPMALVGITTSGCPLYPSRFLCLNLPWSITGQNAIAEAEAINGWKSWLGSPPPGTNFLLWMFGEWLKLAKFNILILLLIIISGIFTIHIFKKAKISQIKGEIWLLVLGSLGIIFIMTQAPLVRFGLGYFILIPSLLVAKYCHLSSDRLIPQFLQRLTYLSQGRGVSKLLVALLLFLASVALIGLIQGEAQSRFLLPPKMPSEKVLTAWVNNIKYVFPKNSDKCWAAELPCASEPIAQNIKLRDRSRGLGGGFIHVR